jgi:hypothetical protein
MIPFVQKLLLGTLTLGWFVSTVCSQDPLPNPYEDPELPERFELVVPEIWRVAVCSSVGTGTGAGVVVDYPSPLVRTVCEDFIRIICDPPSGSVFSIGTTTVECVATTGCGEQATASFVVEVVLDSAAPVLECPDKDWVVYTTSDEGVVVNFPIPHVQDDADNDVQVICEPASGTLFPPGRTEVVCTAIDTCGNETACSF